MDVHHFFIIVKLKFEELAFAVFEWGYHMHYTVLFSA
jgi:hypothetical protein